jgi:hypothetical protein
MQNNELAIGQVLGRQLGASSSRLAAWRRIMSGSEMKCIVKPVLGGLAASSILGIVWLASYLQARFGLGFTESLIEWVQLAALAATAGTFFWMARKLAAERGGLVLMGSLFMAMLIRENDRILNIGGLPGWECALIAYLAVLAYWERRHAGEILPALGAFARSQACPLMVVELALLLVYSRLFGSHLIWQYLVWDDDLHFIVRRMVEESEELTAYSVMFIASRIYLSNRK